ncbi:FtsW/RodA/SpoVE family cell cycle protein [Gracilibacillus halotolerans]|nr:FtsW/RodA/SpoVE family cell cycle protein [Gracilibacillus halotolerans]
MKLDKLDLFLILIIGTLGIISCFTLYTLHDYLPVYVQNSYLKQIIWFVIGGFAIIAAMFFDMDFYRKLSWPLYILGVLSLIGLFFLPWGWENKGALRWYMLPIGGVTIQPSEFMKIFLVLALAHITASHNERWTHKNVKYDLVLLGKIVGLSIIPFVLIVIQPDLGSALVIASIALFTLIVSGIRWRTLFTLFGGGLLFVGTIVLLYFSNPDRFISFLRNTMFKHVADRIQAWHQPELYQDSSAMQGIKSTQAIGSGQMSGKGIMNYEVYIPERHTDMIFTAIGEQFGFIGSSIVIILYFLLLYRMISIAIQTKNPFGSYICVGFVGMFTYQIFQNIGMSVQLLPLTGIPLPFMSYGGTSLLIYMVAIGIVLNAQAREKTYMFDTD